MTPAEFVGLAPSLFQAGDLVSLSGKSYAKVYDVLCQARAAIQALTRTAIVYDFDTMVYYPFRLQIEEYIWSPDTIYQMGNFVIPSLLAQQEIIFVDPFNCSPTIPPAFRYKALNRGLTGATEPLWPTTANHTVVDRNVTWIAEPLNLKALVFELMALWAQNNYVVFMAKQFDPATNQSGMSLQAKVVVDLFNEGLVYVEPPGKSLNYPSTEPFPFIRKVYFYDTDAEQITYIKQQIPDRP